MCNSYYSLFSEQRLSTYLKTANGDESKAIKLYQLNISLSESLYPLLCIFEITLKNKINHVLINHFGSTWFNGHNGKWFNGKVLELNDITITLHNRQNDQKIFPNQQLTLVNNSFNNELNCINQVKRELLKKSADDSCVNTDNLTANLSFGFWTGIMKGEYERTIWQKCREEVFSNSPKRFNLERNFKKIRQEINRIREMRNRVAHYEPLFGTSHQHLNDLIFDYYNAIEYLSWLGQDAGSFLLSQDRFITVINSIQIHPGTINLMKQEKITFLDKNIFKYY